MIRWTTVFIDRPADRFVTTRDFWSAATATTPTPTRGAHDEFVTLLPASGDACLRIQRTLDGSAGSHIDLHVDDVRASTAAATGLGATVVEDRDTMVVMRSPGDLTFCLVAHDGEHERPAPVGAPGARTLVDQASIDVAPDRFERECRFWAELTGWTLRPGPHPSTPCSNDRTVSRSGSCSSGGARTMPAGRRCAISTWRATTSRTRLPPM